MKKCLFLFVVIFSIYSTSAEWTQRSSVKVIGKCISFGKTSWMSSTNGIVNYDVSTREKKIFTTINTDLPGNRVNDMFLMKDNNILISTDKGLSLIKNGSITSAEPICSSYPDIDSRFIYTDKAGNIFTFSSHKVHFYKNGIWKSVDLSSKVSHEFDIMFLLVANDKIWAAYEDNSKTTTTFYGQIREDYLHLAIVADTGVVKLFETYNDFPYRQGSLDLLFLGDEIGLRNSDGIYLYRDSAWTSRVSIFNPSDDLTTNIYSPFVDDGKGNLWYTVNNSDGSVSYPVSYNIANGKITECLKDERLSGVSVMGDGTVLAHSSTKLFIKNDTGWVRKIFSECLSVVQPLYFIPFKIDGKYYIEIAYAYQSDIPEGTFLCLDDTKLNFYLASEFPYSSIIQFAINRKQQGFFKGKSFMEPAKIEKDSAFTRPDLMSNVYSALPCGDGRVYFTTERNSDSTISDSYLSTWEGNVSKMVDLGYKGKKCYGISTFDVSGNYIAALSNYYLDNEDSLESYIALLNTSDNTIRYYDKYNAQMPDWYYYKNGLIWYQMDTVPRAVSIDKYMNIWVGTNRGIMKISNIETKFYETPRITPEYGIYMNSMFYDSLSEELLCSNITNFLSTYRPTDKLYFFNIKNEKWDSVVVSKAGIHGNLVMFKKLLDNRIWASDTLGYLYRYAGNGKFEEFDLEFNGKKNTGFTINDFCIDVNNYLHLGTDIGLFTNKTLLTTVEKEIQVTDELEILPNPATDFIEITVGANGIRPDQNIEIFSVYGEIVLKVNLTTQYPLPTTPMKIDVADLAPGIYFVRIGAKVGKFVKINN